MKIILFDLPEDWANLLPLTFTDTIADIRVGIYTIKERWQKIFPNTDVYTLSADYLSQNHIDYDAADCIYINATILPSESLIKKITALNENKGLKHNNDTLIAYRGLIKSNTQNFVFPFADVNFDIHSANPFYQKALLQADIIEDPVTLIKKPHDIFLHNGMAIQFDFERFVSELPKGLLMSSNKLIGSEKKLYISPTAKVEGAIINTDTGYVYIGDGAEVMEGSLIRGPFALCNDATLKMGTKIYGATTIGPHCKVGGEVTNSVFSSFSNKAHDGFIGNSIIGKWCNLGADTNNSNLKNNYGEVKTYNYATNTLQNTELQFCGLVMGDYSKCSINTMFNTGTIVGVGANLFGADFHDKHVPSFAWGSSNNYTTYQIEKLFYTANEMMKRRHTELSNAQKEIVNHIFKLTKTHRSWEHIK